MKKKQKIYQVVQNIQKLQGSRVLSWKTQAIFGRMSIFGGQVTFGCDNDYAGLDQVREALTELVDEFGGKVDWK